MSPPRRGQCPVCRYRFRLRKDGALQTHHLYSGSGRNEDPCAGSGKHPQPLRWDPSGRPDCLPCLEYLFAQPHLVGACASVGIERGKSTGQMLCEYLSAYHDRDHEEAA